MKEIFLALTMALVSSVAGADSVPAPGGPFEGSQIDAKTYLLDKTVDYSVARSLPYKNSYWVAFENVMAGNERLLILMGWKSGKGAKFEPVAIAPLTTIQVTKVLPGSITIDGNDADWAGIPPAATDASGDSRSMLLGTDLVSLTLARDDKYLYARIGLFDGPAPNIMYVFELEQYFLQIHTPGDVLVNCGNPMGGGWQCLVPDRTGAMRNMYPPGSGNVAPGTGFLEWKIPISDLANLPSTPAANYPVGGKQDRGVDNRFVRMYVHPNPGEVADEIDWFKRPLIINFYQ